MCAKVLDAGLQFLTFFLSLTLSLQSCIPQGLSPEQQSCTECIRAETKTQEVMEGEEPHPIGSSELMG